MRNFREWCRLRAEMLKEHFDELPNAMTQSEIIAYGMTKISQVPTHKRVVGRNFRRDHLQAIFMDVFPKVFRSEQDVDNAIAAALKLGYVNIACPLPFKEREVISLLRLGVDAAEDLMLEPA